MPTLKKRAKAVGVSVLQAIPPMPSCIMDTYVSTMVGKQAPAVPMVDFVPQCLGAHEVQRLPMEELPAKVPGSIRLVIVSDTHERHQQVSVPAGDIFVHCGDILMASSLSVQSRGIMVLTDFDEWLDTIPCTDKVVIGGNHDIALQRAPHLITNAVMLNDSAVEVSGLKVYGNSYSEGDSHNTAWQTAVPSVSDACNGADVVVSHECADSLQQAVFARCQPAVWASGHNHDEHGVKWQNDILFANAAIQDEGYSPVQPPVVVDLLPKSAAAEMSQGQYSL